MSDSPPGSPVSGTSNTHSAAPFQKASRSAKALPGGGGKAIGGSGVAVGGGGGAGVALGVTVGVRVGVGCPGVALAVGADVTVGEAGVVGVGETDGVAVAAALLVEVAVDGGLVVALGVGGIAVLVADVCLAGLAWDVPVALAVSGSNVGTRVGTCQAEQALDSPSHRIRHKAGTRPT